MSSTLDETTIRAIDEPPVVKDVVPGTRSGAEMQAYREKVGAFEVWAEQYQDIGPGKKYADSTEYVQAMREQMPLRGRP